MSSIIFSNLVPSQTWLDVLGTILYSHFIIGGYMTVFEKLHKYFRTHEAIAKAFKIRRQGVTYWKKNGIPTNRALEIEKKTAGEITALDVLRG